MTQFLPLFFSTLFCTTVVLHTCPAIAQTVKSGVHTAGVGNDHFNAAPLLFTENKGQVADAKGNLRPDILFTAHSNGAKIFLTATGIHYQFEKSVFPDGLKTDKGKVKDREKLKGMRGQMKAETHRFTLSLQGANPFPIISKKGESGYTENFYLAHCPNGITGVHTYSKVIMEDVYPGIDWVVYSTGTGMEYDFIVHPGATPSLIKLKVSDARAVQIDEDGGLTITTALGKIKEHTPVSYCGGAKIATAFRKGADETISFAVAEWDKHKLLTIDPSVTWSTYYGGTGDEEGGCTVDASGNVYLSGSTTSASGIASGGFQNTFQGNEDAFLVKFSSSGTRLWATYYGGSEYDEGYICITDGSGSIYVAGETNSTSGIASGGLQNTLGGNYDAYLVKFSSSGTRVWATYYGGPNYDGGGAPAIDNAGNVYLDGYTGSASGIASGGFQNTFGGTEDAFLVKFSSSGTRLWATYYGGSGDDGEGSCSVDGSGNVYLTGYTGSASGIASGGFQNTFGGDSDAFLVKFNSSGARLWGTYYGGSADDNGYFCPVDGSGNVYLSGYTSSATGIASGGFQNTYGGGGDAFLVKFNSSGARLWSTYYGGGGQEESSAACIDASGNVYLSGLTSSTSAIASGGFQNTFGGYYDAYLVKFNSSGTRQWGSYFGGNDKEAGFTCASDGSGNVYLSGSTFSASGIASGGFQNTFGGGNEDAFLAKIYDGTPVPIKLISFTAQKDRPGRNQVQWRTVMETKGATFIIQYGGDGRRFEAFATIAGKSESGASYSVSDDNPLGTITYYRLKMTERDGTITFSNIVAVRGDGENVVTVSPVPAKTNVTITNANTLLNGTKAIITDIQGREVYHFTLSGASFIDVSGWASGIYHLRLSDGSVIRLMKE